MSSLPGRSVVTESARSRSRKKQIIDLFNSPGRIPNRSNSDNAGRRTNLLKTKLGIPTSPQSSPDASHSVELGLGSSADHYAVTTFNRLYSSPVAMKTKVHHYSSREVAEELCMIDAELLRKIQPEELENGAWMKNDRKYQLSPNVLAMVHASNEIAMLVPGEILSETSPQGMAKAISTFIKIASKCYAMYNFNSLKAVLAGLQCTPIFRLKKSWKEVPAKRKKKFEFLTKMMSEDRNYINYHRKLSETLADSIPCIPFLGILLTTIVQKDSALNYRKSLCTRRKFSGVEDYTTIEAITVRNRLKKLISQSSFNQFSLANGCEYINAISHPAGEKNIHINTLPKVPALDEANVSSKNLSHHSSISDFDIRQNEKLEPSTIFTPSDSHCLSKSNPLNTELLPLSSSIPVLFNPSDILEVEWANASFRKRSSALNSGFKRTFTLPSGSSQNGYPDQEHARNRSKQTLSDNPIHFIGTTPLVVAKGLNSDVQKFSHVLTSGGWSSGSKAVVEQKRVDSVQEGIQVNSEFMLSRESDTLTLDQSAPVDVAAGATPDADHSNNRACNDINSANASHNITSADIHSTSKSLCTCAQRAPLQSRRMDRCRSYQNFYEPPNKFLVSSSIHNSCSADCITDMLKIEDPYNPTNEQQDPIDKTISDILSSSISSEEGIGIGVSNYKQRESNFTAFKEYIGSPFACSHLDVELNRAHSSTGTQVGDSIKAKPNHNLNQSSRSIDRCTLYQKRHSKSSFLSELKKFYDQQEQAQSVLDEQDAENKEGEGIPETDPKKERSRRRGSCVLCFAQASIGKGSWSNLLFRYQVSSLGRSFPYTSRYKLRKLITEYPRNTESQYYRLSYEREPQ